MPPIFIKSFKSGRKCARCSILTTLSLCKTHLIQAKLEFRSWSRDRRAIGKCIRCNRKAIQGQLRCPSHSKLNKKQCHAWSIVYGPIKYYRLRAQGLCTRSPVHGPATHGTLCATCRIGHNLSKAKTRQNALQG